MKIKIGNRRIGTFLNIAVFLLAVASLIAYLLYATSAEGLMVPWVVVLLLLVIAGEAVLFFFDNDYIPILMAVCSMLAFGVFLYTPPQVLGSLADYMQNIVMFGNPEDFGIIVTIIALELVMSLMAIVSCFFERIKK